MKIDTGDTVKHLPSGERWVVACVDVERNELSWIGWPEGTARLSDCVLVEKAPTDRRELLLQQMAAMKNLEDHRCRYARKALNLS